jgi:predicted site-specific integrase-resolvase
VDAVTLQDCHTPESVAKRLGVSLRTLRRLPIPVVSITPRRRVYLERDVVAYLERQRRKPA